MKDRFIVLRIVVSLLALVPFIWLTVAWFAGGLGVNPIQTLEQRSGDIAITLLILTLACAPLQNIFGWQGAPIVRRILGLYTFGYAALHMLVFVWLDYGLSWVLLREVLLQRPFILLGLLALVILTLLAVTSFHRLKRALGNWWKWLQRLIYIAALLAIFHFALARKGNIFTLQGDVAMPLAVLAILAFLLILRIPFVYKNLAKAWSKTIARKKDQKG